jgi:hypothetical protein
LRRNKSGEKASERERKNRKDGCKELTGAFYSKTQDLTEPPRS